MILSDSQGAVDVEAHSLQQPRTAAAAARRQATRRASCCGGQGLCGCAYLCCAPELHHLLCWLGFGCVVWAAAVAGQSERATQARASSGHWRHPFLQSTCSSHLLRLAGLQDSHQPALLLLSLEVQAGACCWGVAASWPGCCCWCAGNVQHHAHRAPAATCEQEAVKGAWRQQTRRIGASCGGEQANPVSFRLATDAVWEHGDRNNEGNPTRSIHTLYQPTAPDASTAAQYPVEGRPIFAPAASRTGSQAKQHAAAAATLQTSLLCDDALPS